MNLAMIRIWPLTISDSSPKNNEMASVAARSHPWAHSSNHHLKGISDTVMAKNSDTIEPNGLKKSSVHAPPTAILDAVGHFHGRRPTPTVSTLAVGMISRG